MEVYYAADFKFAHGSQINIFVEFWDHKGRPQLQEKIMFLGHRNVQFSDFSPPSYNINMTPD